MLGATRQVKVEIGCSHTASDHQGEVELADIGLSVTGHWARRGLNSCPSELAGAVGPPETVDAASLTDGGLVKAFEEQGEESSEVWVP